MDKGSFEASGQERKKEGRGGKLFISMIPTVREGREGRYKSPATSNPLGGEKGKKKKEGRRGCCLFLK